MTESGPNWDAFDLRWGDLLDQGPGRNLPYGLKNVKLSSFEAPGTFDLNLTVAFYKHALQKRKWSAGKFVSKVCDEPASRARWKDCADNCRRLKERLRKEGLTVEAEKLVRCEVTTAMGQVLHDPLNRWNTTTSSHSVGSLIVTPSSIGVFAALVNFVECTPEHCADYPPFTFRNTREDYDAWMNGHSPDVSPRELWLYQSCMSDGCWSGLGRTDGCIPSNPCRKGWPSLMIDNPKVTMHRALPLISQYYNASGELYWHVNFGDTCTRDNPVGNCPFGEGGVDPQSGKPTGPDFRWYQRPKKQFQLDTWHDQLLQGGNGDGQLTYPGVVEKIGGQHFIPVSSIRLKALRDGIEDGMWLSKLGRKQDKDKLVQELVQNAFTYQTSGKNWEAWREKVGTSIENSKYDATAKKVEVFI
eukprot:gnl/TRDRNA2_/TRDRNA2_147588_c1_seq1.p1 gnl/TRDRNA2_/TRDRNA2_147588_c1~~gnl/TRDRNA2_/TRDRNA2_147588_c1_seq1.p1  ORF type:complete len:451 (+),score=13.41 gnl/TRDRNA2_/TRDRNA2_147588_c1_seq1:109-1353(+)